MSESKGLRNLFLTALFIGLLTVGLHQFETRNRSIPDFDGKPPGGEIIVTIDPGESGSSVGKKLFTQGVVKSSEAFFKVALADPRSARIAPGEHRLQKRISAAQALEQLLDSRRIPNLVIIRDGAWSSEVRTALSKAGFSAKEVSAAFAAIKLPEPFGGKGVEGFLYPAFYIFSQGESAVSLLTKMIDRFNFEIKDVNWSNEGNFSPYQVMIVASLVESEGTPDVHGKVARVIYNRLSKGMPLQLDSTIHYILQRRGQIRVSINETQVANKYNTFLRQGLPPTPIGSPTRASISAALNPEKGDWLYFVTVKPGQTEFTSNYQEFLALKAEYKKNLAAGLFK